MILNAIILTVSLLVLFVLLRQLRQLHDRATTFLFVVLWGRFLASSFSQYTLIPVVDGLRLIAVYTILVIALSLFFVNLQDFLRKHLIPFYVFISFATISSVLNGEFAGLVEFLARWGFFFIVALLLYRAFERHGLQPILVLFVIALSSPILVQFISLALGIGGRLVDSDYVVFVSGFPSKNSFAQVGFILVCLGALMRSPRETASLALGLAGFISIFFAYYRTTLLGALPIFLVVMLYFVMRNVAPFIRPITLFLLLASGILLMPLASSMLPDRFVAVVEMAKNIDTMLEPTVQFDSEDQELGTGRMRIWSNLIHDWREASMLQHVFGFGIGALSYSPHSDYVGTFYSLSFPGLVLLLGIFLWQLVLMTQVEDSRLALRLMACLTGYMIICSATTPLWEIEGLVSFALICATTWVAADGALRAGIDGTKAGDRSADGRIGARWRPPPAGLVARGRTIGVRSFKEG